MKNVFFLIIISFLLVTSLKSFSQDENINEKSNRTVIYSVFLNIIPDNLNIPLIGFVNIAQGNHKGAQVGFVNWNHRNFKGAQISFVNTIGGSLNGAQLGFVNTVVKDVRGLQISFVNTACSVTNGFQLGFVNTNVDKIDGAQISFVNTACKGIEGFQLGMVNTSVDHIKGSQIGFINTTKSLKGFQLGLINYCDTIENGFPLGLISIVKKGGYHAIEIGVTEMAPINLSYKIGIEKFYTSIIAAYSGNFRHDFAFGLGFGSIFHIGNSFLFNPEISTLSTIERNNQQVYSFVPNFGYSLNKHFHILLGPSISWGYNSSDSRNMVPATPFFSFYDNLIDSDNRLTIGARLAIRYRF